MSETDTKRRRIASPYEIDAFAAMGALIALCHARAKRRKELGATDADVERVTLRDEVGEWNAEVERRKAEKRQRKEARKGVRG